MKYSAKKIFRSIFYSLVIAIVVLISSIITSADFSNSYEKIDNLYSLKEKASQLKSLSKDNHELIMLQNGTIHLVIQNQIEGLKSSYNFNFIEKMILSNTKEYLADLEKLGKHAINFNNSSDAYFKNSKSSEDEEIKRVAFEASYYAFIEQIDLLISKSIGYNKEKHAIENNILYLLLIMLLLIALWYKKSTDAIYNDLAFLHNIEKANHTIFTKEADAIAFRMKRKPSVSENPAMLDPITGVSNLKGLMNSYAEKKGMKESNFTSVTVFEIDNFSKSEKKYSDEFTNDILKKIAYTIGLHEQVTDVVARTDYNQFIIVLSRPNKELGFKDADTIRQSISELKFSSAQTGSITVTVSGGYVIKPNNVTLEESIKQAKKVLQHAKGVGINTISQVKDLAQSELKS
ncbi:MAG: hypothetical protein QG559_705 [Campylobacterota bacterium]|nr:hypothetical protein [Campylobacterota bacterium]